MIKIKDIQVDTQNLQVRFIWADDSDKTFTHQQLREACNCAFCKTKRFTHQPVTFDQNVKITEIYDQGYGIQICFSDGHDKGIYPWVYLYQLNIVKNEIA